MPGTYIQFYRQSTRVVSIRGEEMWATFASPTVGSWRDWNLHSGFVLWRGLCSQALKILLAVPCEASYRCINKKAALCHFQEHWHFSDPGCVMFSSITTFISQRREISPYGMEIISSAAPPPLQKSLGTNYTGLHFLSARGNWQRASDKYDSAFPRPDLTIQWGLFLDGIQMMASSRAVTFPCSNSCDLDGHGMVGWGSPVFLLCLGAHASLSKSANFYLEHGFRL